MSSPSRTKDLHDAHCPSLQPCMSMIPCSAAARRTVWSSSTSMSMPTGSNRTTCLSLMGWSSAPSSLGWGGGEGPGAAPSPPYGGWSCGSGVRGRGTAGGGSPDIGRVEGLLLVLRHLVEEDVRALQRWAPAQVVERPHLLGVEVEVRLRDERLAVVADVAHVGDDVGPVPAVVERLPLALADQLAHVRRLPALVGRPERLDVRPAAGLVAVGPHLAVDLGHDHVLADQARHHARPAPVRVLVVDVLEDDRVVAVGHREARVVLPPGA